MYDEGVINKNLSKAEKIIKERHNLPSNWMLRPPSSGNRLEMREHFSTLLDNKGYLIRDLTKEERLWILVENTFCKLDFLYFSSNYGKILDWTGKPVFFTPNIAQNIVLHLLAESEAKSHALWFMYLKARQEGITTLFQMILAHRSLFYHNVGAYTGSAEESKSRKMVEKLEYIYSNLDWWIRPRRTAYRAGDFMTFGDINSSIYVQWGNQKGGIARGSTPTIAHMSEVSTYLDPDELIDASLARAMHENPFSLLALESTANVLGDWWHKTWEFNLSMDSQGLARYKPVFLPWYVASDLYPTKAGYSRRPAPDNWKIPSYVEKHALAAEQYVKANSILSSSLGSEWKMTLKQKWWYYLEFEEAKKKDQLHILLRELPASADEAFQNANPSVFSLETLIEVRTESNASKPLGVYQISGSSIPAIYSTEKVNGEPIIAKAYSIDHEVLETYYLDPIDLDNWPDSNPDLKLYIWEWPEKGETYAIGVDPSEGVEQDSSVISIIKKATPFHPDIQVAEWASNKVAAHDLWSFVYCLSHLYTVRNHNGDWIEPLAVIEINFSAGYTVQTEMRKRGYTNFYRSMDFTSIGESGSGNNSKSKVVRDKIGWKTDRINRPRLLSLFRKMVRDGSFKIKSPFLSKEMSTLEYNLDKKRIEASQGRHDDRVMASSIVLCAWYDPEIYGTEPSAFIEQRSYESALESNPIYMGNTMIGKSSRFVERVVEIVDSRSISY